MRIRSTEKSGRKDEEDQEEDDKSKVKTKKIFASFSFKLLTFDVLKMGRFSNRIHQSPIF
jgi:hypothetical protein